MGALRPLGITRIVENDRTMLFEASGDRFGWGGGAKRTQAARRFRWHDVGGGGGGWWGGRTKCTHAAWSSARHDVGDCREGAGATYVAKRPASRVAST